ncbi:MAG: CpaF family protein [Coriobacteriaceae bacterium]|nr:CpaF family protein [Coriobacteriaceae bacterium]
MSLMTRVQEAGNDVETMRRGQRPSVTLMDLRHLLQDQLPSEKLARMVAENPMLAENEVRSICRKFFEDEALPGMARMAETDRNALIGQLVDRIFGLGPIESLFADDGVTEVMVNGPNAVFYERDGVIHRSQSGFSSEDEIRALIDRIVGPLGRRIDEGSPMVNARLADGSRVNAIIPPVSRIGPVLTIRRFPRRVITLHDMMRRDFLEESMARFLAWAVRAKVNIAVSGGTGTGKTTLLNALSCEIPPNERVITIEDSAELRFLGHPHVVSLEARPMNAEGTGEIAIRDLVINALRMRPDRIVVGECRGAEALDMLQAMNTGHDGSLTTLHANSPDDAILRLMTMVRYAADLPVDVIERQIASAIGLGVQIARDAAGTRYVTQAVEYCFDEKAGRARADVFYERAAAGVPGVWKRIPRWVGKVEELGIASWEEVEEWVQQIS